MVEREEAGPDLPLDPGAAKCWVLHLKLPDLDTLYRLDATKQKQAGDEQRRERSGDFGRMMIGVLLLVFIVGAGCRRGYGKANRSRDAHLLPKRPEELAIRRVHCVEKDAAEGLRKHLDGRTQKSFKELLFRFVVLDENEIDQVVERRENWRDVWSHHYDLRPTIDGVQYYIETRLAYRKPEDADDPVIYLVNIKPA